MHDTWEFCRQVVWLTSLQSWCNFGKRELSIFVTKIMATIFDFNGSRRLRRERNLYQGGGCQSKIRRGVEVEKWKLYLLEVIVILQNSLCPQTEFLICAVKLQLSITSHVSFEHHSDIFLWLEKGKDYKLWL